MSERLRHVPSETDLIVVGGGINGAGVARDAALRGHRVVLVERHDFGCGSSGRTSKLIHGGVRYLEQRAWRLVREACHERRILLQQAPHLVRPLPFVFPVYRDSRFGPWKLRAGMWLYDLLAGFANVAPHRMLRAGRGDDSWREGLRAEGLRGAALYYDALMDDARLVLANVLGAVQAGALAFNRVAATHIDSSDSGSKDDRVHVTVRDLENGASTSWRARCVVLCAGPWTNSLFAMLGDSAGAPPLAPTRGTHLVVRRLAGRAFTLAAGRDGRVFFVLPWLEDRTLIGTTDVDDRSDPARVAPTEVEIEYLLAETNHHFPAAHLERRDVLAAFAGQRPLLRAGGTASSRSREHAILEPLPRVLAVVGGKYTTYRAVAEAVVDRAQKHLVTPERPAGPGPRRFPAATSPGGRKSIGTRDRASWPQRAIWPATLASTKRRRAAGCHATERAPARSPRRSPKTTSSPLRSARM
jgi:glycerol-3-phosphate dehydrogenase